MPKVVILDDQATDRHILDRLARNVSADIEVETFARPSAALAWLAQHQADLILLDYRLPEMDGVGFLHALRELSSSAGVPVIMITIVDDIDVRYRSLEAGATDFLTKPLDLQECAARFRNLLTLREQRLAIERQATELAATRQRMSRALRTLSTANSLLSSSCPEPELLRGICTTLVEQAGYPAVRIGLWNDRDSLHEVATATASERDIEGPDLSAFDACGVVDRVRTTSEHQIIEPRAGQDGQRVSSLLDAAGQGACALLPLRIEGLVDGILLVVAREPDAFDRDELELLTRTASDLGYGIAARRARHARDRAQRDARYLTHFDRLTGLPNQNQVLERLREMIEQPDETIEAAILVIDLDRFKLVNDTAGQEAGDELLLRVAERLRATLRSRDLLARQSGDEFLLLITEPADKDSIRDTATRAAGRITESLGQPFAISGYEYYIGASVGIRCLAPDDTNAQAVLRQAHTAMHQAKQSGGNTYSCYTGELTNRQTRKLSLEGRLRRTLDQSGLQLYFQPILDLAHDHIAAVEALVRWPQDDGSILGPPAFVPLAEEVGLIERLGHWVFEAACRQGRTWEGVGFTPTMSINLSLHQLLRPRLASEFATIVRDARVTPERIQIEITESAMMTDPGRTEPVVYGLHDYGMRIALDDFGTGYSSFSHLSRLPISTLKIDKCFIAGITSDPHEQTIVRSMVQLAHNLGLDSVAEGIEESAQHRALAEMGCQLGQGFLFHRPMPADQIDSVLLGLLGLGVAEDRPDEQNGTH